MNIGDMDIEKLLLIVLLIAILYYPLCGIVGFIEFIQNRKREIGYVIKTGQSIEESEDE